MRGVLRQRDFALGWFGGLVSMLGSWALWIALPIHVYQLTGSALATSGVIAAVVAPGVLIGSVAGVFVDRWNRKTTLVAGNLLLAVATLPLIAARDEAWLWVVYPSAFLLSTLEQFTDPAENAFLPRLVRAEDLVAANSLNALNNSLARLGGPALGGALYASLGLAGAVTADAVRRWRRVWVEWRDGLEVVRRERAVAIVFVVTALTAIGEGVFGVMFVVWVRDVLEGGARELGWLHTSQAAGGLIGGAVGAYVGR